MDESSARRFGGFVVMTATTVLAIAGAIYATFVARGLGFFLAVVLLTATVAVTRRVAGRRRR